MAQDKTTSDTRKKKIVYIEWKTKKNNIFDSRGQNLFVSVKNERLGTTRKMR